MRVDNPSRGDARKVLLAALKVQAAAEADAFITGNAGTIPTDLPVVRDGDRILRADGQFADDLTSPPEWEPWMGWEAQRGWDE